MSTRKKFIKTIDTKERRLYQCPECGMKYLDRKIAKKCRAWCSKYKACNLEYIKYAVSNEN